MSLAAHALIISSTCSIVVKMLKSKSGELCSRTAIFTSKWVLFSSLDMCIVYILQKSIHVLVLYIYKNMNQYFVKIVPVLVAERDAMTLNTKH